jgi:hypothetical protein
LRIGVAAAVALFRFKANVIVVILDAAARIRRADAGGMLRRYVRRAGFACSAARRFSSGRHEPQLVPHLSESCTPANADFRAALDRREPAFAAEFSAMSKHVQTTRPRAANPRGARDVGINSADAASRRPGRRAATRATTIRRRVPGQPDRNEPVAFHTYSPADAARRIVILRNGIGIEAERSVDAREQHGIHGRRRRRTKQHARSVPPDQNDAGERE